MPSRKNCWMNSTTEAGGKAEMSASRAELLMQETVEAEEINEEKWTILERQIDT